MKLTQLFELFGNKLTVEPNPKIMNPALISLIISLVEEAIKQAPGVYADLQSIFSNPSPTPADWQALRAKVLAKTYADYVPASALPGASSSGPSGGGVIPPA